MRGGAGGADDRTGDASLDTVFFKSSRLSPIAQRLANQLVLDFKPITDIIQGPGLCSRVALGKYLAEHFAL